MSKPIVQAHPLAAMFPPMQDDEFEALKQSIADNGLIEPIHVWEDQILDGLHRHRACRDLGIECYTMPFYGDERQAFNSCWTRTCTAGTCPRRSGPWWQRNLKAASTAVIASRIKI